MVNTDRGRVLVTGASGFIGAKLVPALLEEGWTVRVFARTPSKLSSNWRDQVEVSQGDAKEKTDLREALADVDVAYYLLHSMDGKGDFVERDKALARTFADVAKEAGVSRIIYMGGLHDESADLAAHMASRAEVGHILQSSGIPTTILQAGIVLGAGSASFQMLRHLTERLPIAVAPRWVTNRVQPIDIADVVHYLVGAAELPPEESGPLDIGMDEVFVYRDMMRRYAKVTGLSRRFMATVPVLTPDLASRWVGTVTPVPAGVARPLVGSLIHDAVKGMGGARDASDVIGDPEGGLRGFDESVRSHTADIDPKRIGRTFGRVALAVGATAALGSVLTKPDSVWYESLKKPPWQPPAAAFPIVWTALYSVIAAASTMAIAEQVENGEDDHAREYVTALGVNLALNAGWSGIFFRSRSTALSAAAAGLLTASSADLVRRGRKVRPQIGALLTPYAAWCGFATALSTAIARRN